MRRPLERHRTASSCEIPQYFESNFIAAAPQIRRNVQCVIVPDRQAAPRGTNSNADTVDIELISRVCGKVQQRTGGGRGKTELAAESDDAAGRVALA